MSNIKVGARAFVKDRHVLGTIKFVGQTLFSQGKWVGVALDEPLGKNNGTVGGKIYFMCEEDYGLFVRQNQLEIMPNQAAESAITANNSLSLTKDEKPQDTPPSKLTSTDLIGSASKQSSNSRVSMPAQDSASPLLVQNTAESTPPTIAMPSKLDRARVVSLGQSSSSSKLAISSRAAGTGTSPSSSPFSRRKMQSSIPSGNSGMINI